MCKRVRSACPSVHPPQPRQGWDGGTRRLCLGGVLRLGEGVAGDGGRELFDLGEDAVALGFRGSLVVALAESVEFFFAGAAAANFGSTAGSGHGAEILL